MTAPLANATPVDLIPGLDQVDGLVDSVLAARAWLTNRHNWVRIGWFSAGYVMLLAGAYILARPVAAPVVAGTTKAAAKAAKLVV